MKATGIVRRIDELGRVVIPKEIRRAYHIRVGDPLEIYTNNEGGVVFKKFSPVEEMGKNATDYAEALSRATNKTVIICDRDKCIAASGSGKAGFLNRPISSSLDDFVVLRKDYFLTEGETPINSLDGVESYLYCMSPIISQGDIMGSVAFISDKNDGSLTDIDKALITVAALFLGNSLSE